MQDKLVIVDYGMGNLRSVQKKLDRIGANSIISSDPEVIRSATKLVLPGVGHFANGVKKLRESGIWDILNDKVLNEKTPILGICLGMQLMAKTSEEGNVSGFGWFDAHVRKFTVSDRIRYKIPHMGWNQAIPSGTAATLLQGLENASYYFVHSFHIDCADQADILASTTYDYTFTSAIHKGNIYGVQFHPEKSHDEGELLLTNFLQLKTA
jgi:imidazole glycerol-phosphate synthase subunit HisH